MLKLLPLGGLGEIGLNCLALEHGSERLLVDCGLMFPRRDMPGVELVVPDFSALRDRPDALAGVVLTHAHEDHLGALPYLLRELPVPVYGTPFTLAVARHRLDEAGVTAELQEIAPRSRLRIGDAFELEPVRVTHSVPDAVGLVVRTPSATLFHTGDFKLDEDPIDGEPTDLPRLAEIADEGVTVLLSDSTNAEHAGSTGSERRVEAAFARRATQARGRVVIALFSSHLHRVRHAFELASRLGRRVVLAGRSLRRNVELARQTGRLRFPDELLVPWEQAASVPPHRQLVLCTGAQAEPRAALTFFATDEAGAAAAGPGDLFIMSSRVIPGNEPFVAELVNRLLARGAEVVSTSDDPDVHVSGHASQDEQRRVLELVRPRHFVPVHGELRHLRRHAALAAAAGLDASRVHVATDGDLLGFTSEGAARLGRAPSGRHLMRRDGLLPLPPEALDERRLLAEAGAAVVVAALELGGGRLLAPPTVRGQGLQAEETAALPLAAGAARLALEELSVAIRGDDERVREALRHGVRRFYKQTLGTRPVVIPIVVRL